MSSCIQSRPGPHAACGPQVGQARSRCFVTVASFLLNRLGVSESPAAVHSSAGLSTMELTPDLTVIGTLTNKNVWVTLSPGEHRCPRRLHFLLRKWRGLLISNLVEGLSQVQIGGTLECEARFCWRPRGVKGAAEICSPGFLGAQKPS